MRREHSIRYVPRDRVKCVAGSWAGSRGACMLLPGPDGRTRCGSFAQAAAAPQDPIAAVRPQARIPSGLDAEGNGIAGIWRHNLRQPSGHDGRDRHHDDQFGEDPLRYEPQLKEQTSRSVIVLLPAVLLRT